jgi:hypothetical protein
MISSRAANQHALTLAAPDEGNQRDFDVKIFYPPSQVRTEKPVGDIVRIGTNPLPMRTKCYVEDGRFVSGALVFLGVAVALFWTKARTIRPN